MECEHCGYEGRMVLISEGVEEVTPDKWKCPKCKKITEMYF